jgi:hypothetical protein
LPLSITLIVAATNAIILFSSMILASIWFKRSLQER